MRKTVAYLFTMTVAVSACTGTSPAELAEDEGPIPLDLVNSSTDSTYWNSNGVMEFTESGVAWKFQRYGSTSAPYLVRIWKNGSFEADVRMTWSGGSPTTFKWQDADWVKTDPDGDVLDTSLGEPGSGGGGGGGGVLLAPGTPQFVTITRPDGTTITVDTANLDWEACVGEMNAVSGLAATAVAGSAITGALAFGILATRLPFHNVLKWSASRTAVATGLTVAATLDWIDCLI